MKWVDGVRTELFDNAAQAWNHAFYWQSMRPSSGGLPAGKLAARIETDFRGLENFLARFGEAATQNFGSGWTWLILDRGKLRVCSTSNADTPIDTNVASDNITK